LRTASYTVALPNKSGRLTRQDVLPDDISLRVAFVHRSFWTKLERIAASINELSPGRQTDFTDCAVAHSIVVNITPSA
jgi:hypothetical protein